MTFTTKAAAHAHFRANPEGLLDWYDNIADAIEECECCGEWSVSAADHSAGDILSADPDACGFDRICEACDNGGD